MKVKVLRPLMSRFKLAYISGYADLTQKQVDAILEVQKKGEKYIEVLKQPEPTAGTGTVKKSEGIGTVKK